MILGDLKINDLFLYKIIDFSSTTYPGARPDSGKPKWIQRGWKTIQRSSGLSRLAGGPTLNVDKAFNANIYHDDTMTPLTTLLMLIHHHTPATPQVVELTTTRAAGILNPVNKTLVNDGGRVLPNP